MLQCEKVIKSLQNDTVYHHYKKLPNVGSVEYIHTENLTVAPGGVVCIDRRTFDDMMRCIETLDDAVNVYHKLTTNNIDKDNTSWPPNIKFESMWGGVRIDSPNPGTTCGDDNE